MTKINNNLNEQHGGQGKDDSYKFLDTTNGAVLMSTLMESKNEIKIINGNIDLDERSNKIISFIESFCNENRLGYSLKDIKVLSKTRWSFTTSEGEFLIDSICDDKNSDKFCTLKLFKIVNNFNEQEKGEYSLDIKDRNATNGESPPIIKLLKKEIGVLDKNRIKFTPAKIEEKEAKNALVDILIGGYFRRSYSIVQEMGDINTIKTSEAVPLFGENIARVEFLDKNGAKFSIGGTISLGDRNFFLTVCEDADSICPTVIRHETGFISQGKIKFTTTNS